MIFAIGAGDPNCCGTFVVHPDRRVTANDFAVQIPAVLARRRQPINNPHMEIRAWERRYRSKERAAEDFEIAPVPLLVETVESLRPGRALDLACGTGRNALWLAERGWRVTSVDGAPSAIRELRNRALDRHLDLEMRIADLEKHRFEIGPRVWDLVAICYYLQRDLFAPAKRGVAPGGVLLAIVHITQPDEEPTTHRLRPGELRNYFRGWQILHYYEGTPRDAGHKRPVAEIAARKPGAPKPASLNRS